MGFVVSKIMMQKTAVKVKRDSLTQRSRAKNLLEVFYGDRGRDKERDREGE